MRAFGDSLLKLFIHSIALRGRLPNVLRRSFPSPTAVIGSDLRASPLKGSALDFRPLLTPFVHAKQNPDKYGFGGSIGGPVMGLSRLL